MPASSDAGRTNFAIERFYHPPEDPQPGGGAAVSAQLTITGTRFRHRTAARRRTSRSGAWPLASILPSTRRHGRAMVGDTQWRSTSRFDPPVRPQAGAEDTETSFDPANGRGPPPWQWQPMRQGHGYSSKRHFRAPPGKCRLPGSAPHPFTIGKAPGEDGTIRMSGRSAAAPERGVAHSRLEHPERLPVLGQPPRDEAGAVAPAAEGERQGIQRCSGQSVKQVEGQPGEPRADRQHRHARGARADDGAHRPAGPPGGSSRTATRDSGSAPRSGRSVRRGPWPSLRKAHVEAGRGRGAALRVTVFAQFTETHILPDSPPGGGSAVPRPSPTVRSRVGAVETDPGIRRGGIRDVAHPCGKVSAKQVAGSGIPIGERSSTPRRHRPRPATALGGPCRLQGMPPPHECSGDGHYPCGYRFASEEGRRSDQP